MSNDTTVVVRSSSNTHRHAAVPLPAIIEFLTENLGRNLLGLAVGVSPDTVGRWLSEKGRLPRETHEQALRDVYHVFQEVNKVEAAPTVRAWFMGMNPQLDDLSPAEALAEGRRREVLAAARAFAQGG